MEDSKNINRRSFLNISIQFFVTTFLILTGYAFIRYLWPQKQKQNETSSNTVAIAISEISVNQFKFIRYKGKAAILIRPSENEFYAISAVCTHLGCIVKYDTNKKQLICPCHTAVFDHHGNVISGPAPKPLETYPIKIKEGKIIIG
jgi:cytochrome b6-f complex iron-sulfur subunit